jgi:hypothetical protein
MCRRGPCQKKAYSLCRQSGFSFKLQLSTKALKDIVLRIEKRRGGGDRHVGHDGDVTPLDSERNDLGSDVTFPQLIPDPDHQPQNDGEGGGASATVVDKPAEHLQGETELENNKNIRILKL